MYNVHNMTQVHQTDVNSIKAPPHHCYTFSFDNFSLSKKKGSKIKFLAEFSGRVKLADIRVHNNGGEVWVYI